MNQRQSILSVVFGLFASMLAAFKPKIVSAWNNPSTLGVIHFGPERTYPDWNYYLIHACGVDVSRDSIKSVLDVMNKAGWALDQMDCSGQSRIPVSIDLSGPIPTVVYKRPMESVAIARGNVEAVKLRFKRSKTPEPFRPSGMNEEAAFHIARNV